MTHSAPDGALLAAECRTFARHLADAEVEAYTLACYERLLPSAALPADTASLLIERTLLAAGRAGGVLLRMADGYAVVFRPRCALRRRLLLLFAILENSPGTSHALNTGDEGSFAAVSARMIASMTVSVLCTLAGVVVFAPVHVASALASPARDTAGTQA